MRRGAFPYESCSFRLQAESSIRKRNPRFVRRAAIASLRPYDSCSSHPQGLERITASLGGKSPLQLVDHRHPDIPEIGDVADLRILPGEEAEVGLAAGEQEIADRQRVARGRIDGLRTGVMEEAAG